MQDTDTTKYIIHSKINADGIVERPDIVGAIFGQTEGLLGTDLDLRDLQKTGRIGRIEVMVTAKAGKSKGSILIPSSLDRIETSILAASLETIDRVGPCSARIEIIQIEDVRATKRKHIVDRAKYILTSMFDVNMPESQEIADEVRESVRIEDMVYYGKNKIPSGPNMLNSDAIIVVEGRADVLNLLRYGIKNSICVGGTNVPPEVAELTKKKTVTAFTDGDRGGELIIKELLQVADIDFIARAPDGKSVEDLVQREIVRALRQKVPVEQVMDRYSVRESKPSNVSRISRLPKRKEQVTERRTERRTEPRTERRTEPRTEHQMPAVTQMQKRSVKQREIVAAEPEVPLKTSAQSQRFKPHVDALVGTLGARLLDTDDNIVGETDVRDLVNTLKDYSGDVKSVVFDGVITQRILDIAADKEISNLVGVKVGNVTKSPSAVKILTASGL
ncbi:MAG: DNA primase [Methanosarcinaceae archaeon]|nr:DNA primase [Methanosarcinaceae archaeon]